ncbi:MAG: phosphate ABC transporter substrate-binding protein PstS [Gammaproteobacteria bacterium]
MRKRFGIVLIALGLFLPSALAEMITGAGATFPYPLYVKWAQVYQQQSQTALNYQPMGSGGGIKQIQAKTVDFGASDKPLTADLLKQFQLIQFPTVVGGVVPVINLASIDYAQLILSGNVLANIYLGKVKQWNDPSIQVLNPGVALPNQSITVVHRSDGSGTTFLFADYLAKVSPSWAQQVGADTAVAWPVGIGGKGSEGVASYVQRIKGSIGYVEYAYAQQNKLAVVKLLNPAGQAVVPNSQSFAAALEASWNNQNFAASLNNAPGPNSWPIIGATFILLNAPTANPAKSKAVLNFFAWAYANGKDIAKQMDYVPLPDNVVNSIKLNWQTTLKDPHNNPVWP